MKTWRLELPAAGSATAIAQTKAEAAELARLRRDDRRLREENEVMREASAVGGEDMIAKPAFIHRPAAHREAMSREGLPTSPITPFV